MNLQRKRRANSRSRRRRRLALNRRQMGLVVEVLAAATLGANLVDRRIWVQNRAHGRLFWAANVEHYSDETFRSHFRMCRATFDRLAEQLRPLVERQDTTFRRAIPYRERVGIVIWWLATPTEYRTLANMFGIAISTLCVLTRQVVSALLNHQFFQRYISLPQGDRLDRVIEGFSRKGFPQCAGAIDGTHLPIIGPSNNKADYHNRKGWYSIILQAVVDHKYRFTDVYAGWPGRTHDARVFAHSDLPILADRNNGLLFSRDKNAIINGIDIPVCLIGDPAYPLKPWLMKEFVHNANLTSAQRNFNKTLSSARVVVENAFGRLKGRWRRLMKRNDVTVGFSSEVIAACCLLHNFCEIHKEQYNEEWDEMKRCKPNLL
ncbi:uncharacterized protein [Antedon mediterranea]|uniref:uncharacterized protein n=1 Tax=Antedon mediterranea TaxID=105859 RepID=UPI003AF7D900